MPALPPWKTIAGLDAPALPESLQVAVAQVDEAGSVVRANGCGAVRWGWADGLRLPDPLWHALQRPAGATSCLHPFRLDGRRLLGVRRDDGRGWMLIGTEDEPSAPAPPGETASTLESLIEKMPVLVLRLRQDGTLLFASPQLHALTSYTPEEVQGRAFWLEAVHPEDRWKLTAALRQAFDAGEALAGVRFLTPASMLRFVEFHFFRAPEPGVVEAVVFDVPAQGALDRALGPSEALYHTFSEQSPLGLVHLDAQGVVTFENHSFRHIVGEAVEAAWIGRRVAEIPGLAADLAAQIAALPGKGAPLREATGRFVRTDGALRHLVVHGSPIRHPEGGIVGGVLMVQDVTAQRQREEELRLRHRYGRAEASLRKIAQTRQQEAAFLRDAARLLRAATRAEALWVFARRGAGPLRVQQAWGPATATLPLPPSAEEQLPPGQLWFPLSEEGVAMGGLLLARPARPWADTEVRLVEAVAHLFETLWRGLRASSRYRLAVAAIEACLFECTLGPQGRQYAFLGPQVEPLTGLAPAYFLTSPSAWRDLVVPADQPLLERHEAALAHGREHTTLYRIRRADGALRWLREYGKPQPGAAGLVSGVLTDVTEQQHAEQMLRQAKEAAELADRMKSSFIATISHEVRSPLGAVTGFAELLTQELGVLQAALGRPVPSQFGEFVEVIQDNGRRLLALFNDLFDLYNLQTGALQLHPYRVALHDLLQRVSTRHRAEMARKGLTFVLDLAPEGPLLSTDARRLEQVFDHLLSNACKFTEAGTVALRTRPAGHEVVVEVEDTGVGIAADTMGRLFDPFVQEDRRLNRSFAGVGIGLTLVRWLVDRMGGRVAVESTKGKGTLFRVYLPLPDGEAAAA